MSFNELFSVYEKTVLAGKKTSQCKSWIKIATAIREEKGIDYFNELLQKFYDRIKEENK
jgi:hypothetical protein